MDMKKVAGLFFMMWAGAFVVLLFMHVSKGGAGFSQSMSTVVWEEIASESFFYGAIALAVYNIYHRRQRMDAAKSEKKTDADAE